MSVLITKSSVVDSCERMPADPFCCERKRLSQGQMTTQRHGPSILEHAILVHVSDFASSRQCARLAGACHAGLEACRPVGWSPAVPIVTLHVSSFLGASRCTSALFTCRAWAKELRAISPPPRALPESHERLDAAVLTALGAPSFAAEPSLLAEDALYSILADSRLRGRMPEMLCRHSSISAYAGIMDMTRDLRARCKVPMEAVDVLFEPQVEHEKTFFLDPRPIHFAVALSSVRLARMLLGAAAKVGTLDLMLQKVSEEDPPATLSPLFFSVLVGSPDIVEVLKDAGSTPNDRDIFAAGRLQRAGLWQAVHQRMQALQLHAAAAQLDAKLAERREKAARVRAAARAALRA